MVYKKQASILHPHRFAEWGAEHLLNLPPSHLQTPIPVLQQFMCNYAVVMGTILCQSFGAANYATTFVFFTCYIITNFKAI